MPKLHIRNDGHAIIRARREDERDGRHATYQVTPSARDWLRARGIERDGDFISRDRVSYLMQRGWIYTDDKPLRKPNLIVRALTPEERRAYGLPDPQPVSSPKPAALPSRTSGVSGHGDAGRPGERHPAPAANTSAVPGHLSRRTTKKDWFS